MKIPSTRFENPWFSVSGKYRGKAAENFDQIFGKPASKFCEKCGRVLSWCECEKEDLAPFESVTSAIDSGAIKFRCRHGRPEGRPCPHCLGIGSKGGRL